MSYYTFYDPDTGRILENRYIDNPRDLQGRSSIPGLFINAIYYIQNNEPVLFPGLPLRTASAKYDWDWQKHEWVLNINRSDQAERDIRDRLLIAVDRVNPIWYQSLTAEQQQQLQQYRSALLDATDQSGWPTQVDWPVKPAWL